MSVPLYPLDIFVVVIAAAAAAAVVVVVVSELVEGGTRLALTSGAALKNRAGESPLDDGTIKFLIDTASTEINNEDGKY